MLRQLASRLLALPAHFRAWIFGLRIRLTGRPLVFRDWTGYRFWLYAGDPFLFHARTKAMCDSLGVVRYCLKTARPGWTCLDIGANVGAVTLPLRGRVGPEGRVVSVEPDPENVRRLKANLELNGHAAEGVLGAAVAEQAGSVQLRVYEGRNGWQTMGDPAIGRDQPSHLISVPAVTFGQAMEKFGLREVDLAKVDVEGAELVVLAGMRPFLERKHIRRVVFEVNHAMLEGFGRTVAELLAFWADLEYDLSRLDDDGNQVLLDGGRWPEGLIGDCLASARA